MNIKLISSDNRLILVYNRLSVVNIRLFFGEQ